MSRRQRERIHVAVSLPDQRRVEGVWEPRPLELRAAWDLLVELTGSVGMPVVQPLHGSRQAAGPAGRIVAATREILLRYGPGVAPRLTPDRVTFGHLAMTVIACLLQPATDDAEADGGLSASQYECLNAVANVLTEVTGGSLLGTAGAAL